LERGVDVVQDVCDGGIWQFVERASAEDVKLWVGQDLVAGYSTVYSQSLYATMNMALDNAQRVTQVAKMKRVRK
jgi:hypothetical protein